MRSDVHHCNITAKWLGLDFRRPPLANSARLTQAFPVKPAAIALRTQVAACPYSLGRLYHSSSYRDTMANHGRHPTPSRCQGHLEHPDQLPRVARRASPACAGRDGQGFTSGRHSSAVFMVTGWAAAMAVASAGLPRVSAFFSPPPPCVVKRGPTGQTWRSMERRLPVGREHARSTLMSSQEGGVDASKPQSVRTPEMNASTKEMKQPPDRQAALRMIEGRAEEERKGGELGPYAQADIPDLPKPPYYFMVPGEMGNDTLCTDPSWHRALVALKWLGMPVEVRHEAEQDSDEDGPILIMGDEVYDDADDVVSGLPERALLSDFVESLPYVTKAVAKLEPAWTALRYNTMPKDVERLEKALEDALEKIEGILASKKYEGVLFEGDELTVADLTLGVTTFHMQAAFAKDKQWKMPKKLPKLGEHMDEMHSMQIFKTVVPSAELLAKKYAQPK